MVLAQTQNDIADYLRHLVPDTNAFVDFTIKIVQALVALVVILIVARLVRSGATRLVMRRNPNLGALIGNVAYATMLVLALVVVLTIFTGAGFSTLVTLLGVFSLAVSLSIQDVLRNFVAGVYILLERPFSIGDRINLRDTVEGLVESIEIRTTNIRTDDDVQIIVPNSIIFSEIVINRSAYDKRPNVLRLTLNNGQTLTTVTTTVKEVLATFPQISQHPAPRVAVERIEATHTIARVEYFTPKNVDISYEVVMALQASTPDVEIAVVNAAAPKEKTTTKALG